MATESPLEIRIGGTPIAVVMRTPGHDIDLVLGFALTEGIAIHAHEVAAIERIDHSDPDDARYEIRFVDGISVDPEQFRRNLYAVSSCGICGKASIDAVRLSTRAAPPGPTVSRAILSTLPARMLDLQPGFAATGGLHAAALFTSDGTIEVIREDIGRHNAVDKAVGARAADRSALTERILLVSGRVSFEIVQKAAVVGIPIVAGISAVSSLAVDLADDLGMTVVGFVRDDAMNVYSGANRIA